MGRLVWRNYSRKRNKGLQRTGCVCVGGRLCGVCVIEQENIFKNVTVLPLLWHSYFFKKMQVLPFLWQSSLKAVLCNRVVNAASIRCWQRRQSYKNFHSSAKTCSQRRVYVLRGCQSLRVRAKNKELQRKYKLLKKIFIFQSNHCSKTALLFPSSLIGAPDGWCQNLSRSVRLLCVLGQKPSEQTAWFAHFQELPTQPQQFRLWELKTFKILR